MQSLLLERKNFNQYKHLIMEKNSFNNTKDYNLNNIYTTFVSRTYTFFLVGNIIVYTQSQGTNKKKYFIHNIYKGKMPILAGT